MTYTTKYEMIIIVMPVLFDDCDYVYVLKVLGVNKYLKKRDKLYKMSYLLYTYVFSIYYII